MYSTPMTDEPKINLQLTITAADDLIIWLERAKGSYLRYDSNQALITDMQDLLRQAMKIEDVLHAAEEEVPQ